MSTCLIALNQPNGDAWQRLKDGWPEPNHCILTDQPGFVSPEKDTLTEDIKDVAGMTKIHAATGFVTKIQFDQVQIVRLGKKNGYNGT